MNSELIPTPALAALPVRRREILEILDTSLKLYRRYFWVLLGWSALVSSVALVPLLNYLGFFLTPLLYGAVSCCIAAAVRGQNVKFAQCWAFSKPRYGPLLGSILLSTLVLVGVSIAITLVALLIGVAGAWALSSAPEPLQIVGAVVGGLLLLVAFSVLGLVAFGWTSMVPIVVCLEDDKRSTAALGRAFDLLKGNWRRIFGLALIMGLAVMAFFTIVGAFFFLVGIGGSSSLFTSRPSSSAIFGLLGTFSAFITLFSMLWSPAQTLVIAVLYLDLRVRREALDLEWSAYATAPAATAPTEIPAMPANPNYPLSGVAPGAAVSGPLSGAAILGAVAPLETPASMPASFAAGSAAPVPPSEPQFASLPQSVPLATAPSETVPQALEPMPLPFAPDLPTGAAPSSYLPGSDFASSDISSSNLPDTPLNAAPDKGMPDGLPRSDSPGESEARPD